MKNWLLAVLLAPLALLGEGCRRSGSHVRLVVPDEFAGPIQIRQSTDGVPSKRDGDIWVFEIPATGVLETRNTKPLDLISLPGQAVYKSGKPIKWALPEVVSGAQGTSEIMLRQLGTDAQGWFYFFVGTKPEADAHWSTINGAKP